jgi:dihydroorotate dehydrogenase electron transfer subunit
MLFAVVGRGTQWLSQRQKDETLDLLGPLGNGFSIEPVSKKLLLIAGGIGVAPLVFLAQKSISEGRSVKLLLGARTKDGLYPQKHLPDGVETIITTEDGSYGERGKVTDILSRYVDWADQIYACGPIAMYKAIADQRQQWRNKKPVQVSLEVRMGCGIGACFSCSIKTKNGMKQVCRDGPVFNLDEIILEEVKI